MDHHWWYTMISTHILVGKHVRLKATPSGVSWHFVAHIPTLFIMKYRTVESPPNFLQSSIQNITSTGKTMKHSIYFIFYFSLLCLLCIQIKNISKRVWCHHSAENLISQRTVTTTGNSATYSSDPRFDTFVSRSSHHHQRVCILLREHVHETNKKTQNFCSSSSVGSLSESESNLQLHKINLMNQKGCEGANVRRAKWATHFPRYQLTML